MKRLYYFTAGVAVGVAATRRTRRAKEAAKAALAAKLTPSAIAADLADAIAELGNAVGSFAADVRVGAANRRASYRPMVDGATGSVVMVSPEHAGQILDGRAAAERAAVGGRNGDAVRNGEALLLGDDLPAGDATGDGAGRDGDGAGRDSDLGARAAGRRLPRSA